MRARIRAAANEGLLEAMGASGDLGADRQHMWRWFEQLTRAVGSDASPTFLTWYGEGEVFADSSTDPARDGDVRRHCGWRASHPGTRSDQSSSQTR